MIPLLTTTQMQKADRYTIDHCQIPPLVLMEHAALAVVATLKERFGRGLETSRGAILVGQGNNGGDGMAVARLLWQEGFRQFVVLPVGAPKSSEANAQWEILSRLEIPHSTDFSAVDSAHWVVDALLGTGIGRPVEGIHRDWIRGLNSHRGKKWVVSVDIPSGLDGDRGVVLGDAVHASRTVSLGFVKRGQVTGKAADYVGRLTLAPIQIPRHIPGVVPPAYWWRPDFRSLPERSPASHKGDFGFVSVLAGAPSTEGAAILAAWGALRAGAGRVAVVGPDLESVRRRLPPEIMTRPVVEGVGVVGPGLGPDAGERLQELFESAFPLVVDADGLNAIGESVSTGKWSPREATTVYTPHPKEAAGLLGITTEEVEQDRYGALTRLVSALGGTVVLKGKGTLVGAVTGEVWVVTEGNTVLAKGGSGDLLAGVIGALLAQGMEAPLAATWGTYLTGCAAERILQKQGTERFAVTTEVADALGDIWRHWDGSH